MENFEKYAPIELWSYFIDILAVEIGKLCPGVGILFHFSDPGAGVFHWKLSPGRGFWRKKIVARQSVGGGDSNRSNWYLHYKNSMWTFKSSSQVPHQSFHAQTAAMLTSAFGPCSLYLIHRAPEDPKWQVETYKNIYIYTRHLITKL